MNLPWLPTEKEIVPPESIDTTGGRLLEEADALRERRRGRRGEGEESDSSSTVHERVDTQDRYVLSCIVVFSGIEFLHLVGSQGGD